MASEHRALFRLSEKAGVLDRTQVLASNDPRLDASHSDINSALATYIYETTGEGATLTDIEKAWQEAAPVRWKAECKEIKQNLSPTRPRGVSEVDSKDPRYKRYTGARGRGRTVESRARVEALIALLFEADF